MPSDAEFLVTCTNGACTIRNRTPLINLAIFRLIDPEQTFPSYDEAQASMTAIACPSCERAGRDGTLVYVADHLRAAPPDVSSLVPVVLDVATSVWKRAKETATVTGQSVGYRPDKLSIPTGVRLELRPYGGHMLRPGNNDEGPQYGTLPAGQPAAQPKPRYIRELKHDLLYLAYYGSRERNFAKDLGGVSAFEAMTVGAMLALKFDLWFFYGVPTTTDLSQATVSDAELRSITLDTFSKPIYFEPRMLDNPIRPIAMALIYPLGTAMMKLYVVHERIGEALARLRQSSAPELGAQKAKSMRAKALTSLKGTADDLPKKAVSPKLGDLAAIVGERKERSLGDVVAHPYFAASKIKSWLWFEPCLRAAFAVHGLRGSSHVEALESLAVDSDAKVAKAAHAALDRYKPHVEMLKGFEQAEVDELRKIIGGLPETFEPYRAQMHDYAVVDHATAFYIKAILAGVKIGSDSGKVVKQPGRKLAYRMSEGGIKDEPETLDAYADLVIKACEKGTSFNVPPLIMLERQKNESGFRATDAVRELALSVEERKVYVPMVGIDWNNWGLKKNGDRTNFAFSEIFTNSIGVEQKYPGYLGPIVRSRGVGGGQVTTATMLAGVTSPGRAQMSAGYECVGGIPIPKDGTMPTPGNWVGSKGSIERARDLLKAQFENDKISQVRDCTFGNVAGGKKYDCAACLARFKLTGSPELVWNSGGETASYHCNVAASRWQELFGVNLASDDQDGRTEYPCSWLRAVQRYAGIGVTSYERILKTAREVVAVGTPLPKSDAKKDGAGDGPPGSEEADDDESESEAEPDKGGKKKPSTAAAALRAAFERVRKRL